MGATTDKIKGATNEAIGKAKQGIGEATGSDRLQGEGAIQEVKGKGQKALGDAKEATKDAVNKTRPPRRTRISDHGAEVISKRPAVQRPVSFCCLSVRAWAGSVSAYFTASNSTSNISVAFGGITPPAPRAP